MFDNYHPHKMFKAPKSIKLSSNVTMNNAEDIRFYPYKALHGQRTVKNNFPPLSLNSEILVYKMRFIFQRLSQDNSLSRMKKKKGNQR